MNTGDKTEAGGTYVHREKGRVELQQLLEPLTRLWSTSLLVIWN